MTTLQFVDTHNLVAFLSKPTKSEGFEQIVNFLIANPIKYALTINPTIYNSCIEQFWAIIKVKTVNGEVQLQALVDGKKIIVTEASVRCDLQLNDEEGMDCLPNATIFEELTRIGYEKLSQKLTFVDPCHKGRVTRQGICQVKFKGNRSERAIKINIASRLMVILSNFKPKLITTTLYKENSKQGVSDKDVNLSVNEVTLAQALAALKTTSIRPKAKGLVIHEEEQATTPTISSQQPSQEKILDKGKAKMIEPEPVKKLSKKDQLKLDEEVAQRMPKDLKSKSFANIQELFDKAMKRVNTFVDYRTELVEGSSEKAKAEIA
ncbi:hypothetical protein Tco_0323445 [Tanacetum coccineum]